MEIVQGDLMELPSLLEKSKGGVDGYELVVCMGDTLTHLQVSKSSSFPFHSVSWGGH